MITHGYLYCPEHNVSSPLIGLDEDNKFNLLLAGRQYEEAVRFFDSHGGPHHPVLWYPDYVEGPGPNPMKIDELVSYALGSYPSGAYGYLRCEHCRTSTKRFFLGKDGLVYQHDGGPQDDEVGKFIQDHRDAEPRHVVTFFKDSTISADRFYQDGLITKESYTKVLRQELGLKSKPEIPTDS